MKESSTVPERILITGVAGAGKTETYVSLATHCRETDDPRRFYVINCDMPGTVERCNERYDDWQSNISYVNARNWEALVEATNTFLPLITPGDWLVIDGMDKAWVWVRDAFLAHKTAKAGKSPAITDMFGVMELEITGGDYGDRINPAWDRWIFPLLDPETNPAHLLLITPSQPVVVEGMFADDKSVIAEFGSYGVRPMGQKMTGFRVHTVLLAKHERGAYTLTTMGKDRGRDSLDKEPVTAGFPFTYLAPVAGWSL